MTGMPKSKFVEPGTKFSSFMFLKYTRSLNGDMRGLFSCDFCGEERERVVSHVRTGYVKFCHCRNKVRITKHGHTANGTSTATYEAWSAMKKRCLNTSHPSFPRYGGRGITVCQRWLQFDNFLADMGEKSVGKSLDRINNDLGYSTENCRWATMREQNNNRSNNTCITFNGKTMTISDWANEKGIKDCTLSERLRHGWSVEDAITTPTRKLVSRHTNVPPAAK